jgi:NADPH:quinone reductase-like Zn-dependent oxidoreductase
VEIPDSIDDFLASAIANPGMSAWAALMERAHLVAGETVLVNGATGTAGRLAIQLAKYLGAGKIIATGRNEEELEEVKMLGADVVIPFPLGASRRSGAKDHENALQQVFASGIDVVIDYLWGESARAIIVAIAKTVEDGTPIRFVHVGEAGGDENIELPGAALRSSAIVLMGSGVKSVSLPVLLQSIRSVFEAVQPAGLKIATTIVPLTQIEEVWHQAQNKPRLVFSIR